MKRRLEIARGLMHRPKVLFLDEPTLGLDAQTRRLIWEHIGQLNQAYEITMILTTHYMEEADFLCGRVAIIDKGTILALDTPANLKGSLGGDVLTFRVKHPAKMVSLAESVPGARRVKRCDSSVSVPMADAGSRIPEILKMAEQDGIQVDSVDLHKPSLEDVFIHFTGKTIRDVEASTGDAFRQRVRSMHRR